jgi:hypothetical protein
MSGSNRQILELAKQGLNAAEIAEALGYEVEAVAFVLMHDAEIQEALAKVEVNKLDKEFELLEDLAIRTLKSIMENGERDRDRKGAACYVLDQRLGLKQPKQPINVTLNIPDINGKLQQIRDRKRELDARCVEVEAKLVSSGT